MQAKAAKYYRLAEQNGSKTVGNSWYVDGASLRPHLRAASIFGVAALRHRNHRCAKD